MLKKSWCIHFDLFTFFAGAMNFPWHSVLIIGCGSIGARHLRCFQQTGRAHVAACDANTFLLQSISEKFNVPMVSDWEQGLASGKFNAAVVCTPAPLHVPIALCALRNNVHVLIEKPLSHEWRGVNELLDASKQSRGKSAVAYVLHQYPALLQARSFLESGELGTIRHATLTSGQPFHRLRPSYENTYYRDRRLGGGAIQDALTHSANWMESILGPTESVLCDCAHQALPGVEVEDTVHVSARHRTALVNYTLNQFQPPMESTFQFNSERGSVRIELHHARWGVWRENDSSWTWQETKAVERDVHFIAQANAFLDQIEGSPARLCSLEAAAQTLRFNLAALASGNAGARVCCKDIHA